MNSLQRINKTFTENKVFVAYLTAGDGGIKKTLQVALALIAGGVNLLEIGIPFSDPIADGPVIQRAAARALAMGTTLQDVLWLTKEIRKYSDIPLILFSYYNPILTVLKTDYLHQAKQAGIDGILLVDCPIEEAHLIHQQCLTEEIAPIYVITPSTPPARIKKIAQLGQGFLYYACHNGTTGTRDALPDDFQEKMRAVKSIAYLPVVVGFGISNKKMVTQVLEHADGVVIGSLFVQALENGMAATELTALARNCM